MYLRCSLSMKIGKREIGLPSGGTFVAKPHEKDLGPNDLQQPQCAGKVRHIRAALSLFVRCFRLTGTDDVVDVCSLFSLCRKGLR